MTLKKESPLDEDVVSFCNTPRYSKDLEVKFNTSNYEMYKQLTRLISAGKIRRLRPVSFVHDRWRYEALGGPTTEAPTPKPFDAFSMAAVFSEQREKNNATKTRSI